LFNNNINKTSNILLKQEHDIFVLLIINNTKLFNIY